MRQKSGPEKAPAGQVVKDIRRATRRQLSAEEKIRIVLEGVRGEESIAELCRREGIASSMYSKEFLDAGKRRLAGDTARAATSDEVKELRREARALKEAVADLGGRSQQNGSNEGGDATAHPFSIREVKMVRQPRAL
jgi:transposase